MLFRSAAGQRRADRADAIAPGRGTEHDRQPQHGEPDAVTPVLGGQRLGLLRSCHRAGHAPGAPGEQVPATADDAPETGTGRGLLPGRLPAIGRRLGGGPLLAGRRRARPAAGSGRTAGRRGAGRHASDRNPGDGHHRAGRASCPPPGVHLLSPGCHAEGHDGSSIDSTAPWAPWSPAARSRPPDRLWSRRSRVRPRARSRSPPRGSSRGTAARGTSPGTRGRPRLHRCRQCLAAEPAVPEPGRIRVVVDTESIRVRSASRAACGPRPHARLGFLAGCPARSLSRAS